MRNDLSAEGGDALVHTKLETLLHEVDVEARVDAAVLEADAGDHDAVAWATAGSAFE